METPYNSFDTSSWSVLRNYNADQRVYKFAKIKSVII